MMDEPVEAPAQASAPSTLPSKKPSAPPGSLWREDVNFTVEEGLGYFLQRVAVEPEIVGGKFQGFRIVDLRPAEYWQGVDLRPGDVVTQVNGMPIERDIDAYEAFQSLRAATLLRVSLVRGGMKRELVYAIVARDKGSKPASPATGPAAPANPAAAGPQKSPPS
jgi:type II secretory pathway component PulC